MKFLRKARFVKRLALFLAAFGGAASMCFAVGPMPMEKNAYFSGSGVCAGCHSGLKDEAGYDVSLDKSWRATMMGNSARDPFWRMVLRGELIANPAIRELIEDKCSTCHMPMARTTAAAEGGKGQILDEGFANPEHEMHALALDSISCTLCHQINKDNFDTQESYTGHYQIDSVINKVPAGEGDTAHRIYGPFITGEAGKLMETSSGYTPDRALHVQDSALCGTCHNLYTPYVKTSGEMGDHEMPEQVPYTEWKNSDYFNRASCQNCPTNAADKSLKNPAPTYELPADGTPAPAEAAASAEAAPAAAAEEAAAAPGEAVTTADGVIVAGSKPFARPANAPAINQVWKNNRYYWLALQGVSMPYPRSLSFLQDQGHWYTPFVMPGMTGRYDIRGWHQR